MTSDTISQCVYCGINLTAETLTRDHVIPKVRGGYKGDRNIAPACRSCNEAKGPLTASEYFAVRDDLEALAAMIRIVLKEMEPKPKLKPRLSAVAANPPINLRAQQERVEARKTATTAKRMRQAGECIRPLGFTVCYCPVCDPNANRNRI